MGSRDTANIAVQKLNVSYFTSSQLEGERNAVILNSERHFHAPALQIHVAVSVSLPQEGRPLRKLCARLDDFHPSWRRGSEN